jgi:dTDP-4-dehydrorhamnose reductase
MLKNKTASTLSTTQSEHNYDNEREQNLCHNKQENVLIIGVDSQIGIALKNYLTTKKITVFGTTRKKENTNLNTYYFDLEKPDFEIFTNKISSVVFCAATTNIAECEKDPQKHQAINVTNTIKTIEKLAQNNSFVIYLSSNAVFDGKKAFYKNKDKTCPTTLYGKFKTEVEEYLTTELENNSCVLRLTKVITKNTGRI